MADFYGKGRSNYVHFDRAKLDLLIECFPELDYSHKENRVALLSPNGDNPTSWDVDALAALGAEPHDAYDPPDLLDVVHLILTDEPIIWMGIGSEKLRYLVGYATAINPDGSILNHVNLEEIYEGMENPSRVLY